MTWLRRATRGTFAENGRRKCTKANAHAFLEMLQRCMAGALSDSVVQEMGCFALGSLAARNTTHQLQIADAGGIETVIAAMRAYEAHADVQCAALS